MRIGIFGGSFNPIHNGHLNVIKTAKDRLSLDRLIIMPAKVAPHKQNAQMADEKDRYEMCRLAVMNIDGAEVSDYEISKDEVSYSVITLRHFKELYPDAELCFIMGCDMLLYFKKWYKYEEILSLAALACYPRANGEIGQMETAAEELRKLGGKVEIIGVIPFEVSSTQVRELVQSGRDISRYLPESVWKYIVENKLYRVKDNDV